MSQKKIVTKQINYKMTPSELQDWLKIRQQGGGVTKNGKRYQRREKFQKHLETV